MVTSADYSVFYHDLSVECVYLIEYLDDIILIGSDIHGIS